MCHRDRWDGVREGTPAVKYMVNEKLTGNAAFNLPETLLTYRYYRVLRDNKNR